MGLESLDVPTPGSDSGSWGTKLNNLLKGTGAGTLDDALKNTYVAHDALVYEARRHGLALNGTTDDSAALTALIATVNAAGGGVIRMTGTCRLAASVTALSNVEIQLTRGSVIRKDFAAAAGFGSPLFKQTTPTSKISRFGVTGPGTISCTDTAKTGDIFALYGDDLFFRDFTVDTYANRAFLIGGDRIRMYGVRTVNPLAAAGVGGIRMFGGDDFKAVACNITSGDDALQFVPIAPGSSNADLSITNSAYIGCVGVSLAARSIAVTLTDPAAALGTATMTASIRNVSYVACTGSGSNRVLYVSNDNSSGTVENVSGDADLTVLTGSSSSQEALISSPAGTVSAVDLRLRIHAPTKIALAITGGANTSRIRLALYAEAPSNGDTTVTVDASYVTLDGSRIRAGSVGYGVLVGSTSSSPGFKMRGGRVEDIRNANAGVRLATAPAALLDGVSFAEFSGQTSAQAVSVANTTTNAAVIGLDFSGLTTATPVTDSGVNTTRIGNAGFQNQPGSQTWKFTGSSVARNVPTVASAANMTLGTGNVFFISGTTAITSIPTAGNNGWEVTLIFTGTATLTDGGNLKLAGNFVGAVNAVIKLVSDGTDWYEVSRSVN